MEKADITKQILTFKKARSNLLVVIVFTIINIVFIARDTGFNFSFSAILPQRVFWIGLISYFETGNNFFMIIGLIIALFTIGIYFVFWLFANRARALILAALIFFGIDSLLLLCIVYFSTPFSFIYLVNIVFHCWILYYLINGTRAWAKLRLVDTDILNDILQEMKPKIESTEETEKGPFGEEKISAMQTKCRYCDGKLSLKNYACKFCGKGNINVCNKCDDGKIGMLSGKCNYCKKSYKECFYCGGKMKLDLKISDYVCKSCNRVRKY